MKNSGCNLEIQTQADVLSLKEVTQNSDGQNIKILYQKLGSQWYAFSSQNDEIYYSVIEPETFSGNA